MMIALEDKPYRSPRALELDRENRPYRVWLRGIVRVRRIVRFYMKLTGLHFLIMFGYASFWLGGGVFGDHCSPISDTSLIASVASGSEHLSHVKTQLPYALATALIASVLYIVAGLITA